ncbi:MAG: hypothetical protein PHE09_14230 [Oscillospiraceae bacterium]|nr:hypothetical protein [Oscillospiraceae bacterium]
MANESRTELTNSWSKNEQLVAVGHLIGELEADLPNLQDLDYMDMANLAEEIISNYNNMPKEKTDFISYAKERVKEEAR